MRKLVFFGTTSFGLPALDLLKEHFEIPFVVTQPDRPYGRKKIVSEGPVKIWAKQNGIKTLQPEKTSEIIHNLKETNADLGLVASFGQIIPMEILSVPKNGCVNIHASLLPKYRGATPIQTAIINGDKETGATLILMDEKMDHGPILSRQSVAIAANDDFQTLSDKLAKNTAEFSAKTILQYLNGEISPKPQDHDTATFTKKFTFKDGQINWTDTALKIDRKVRALNVEPGSWTTINGKLIKVVRSKPLDDSQMALAGKVLRTGKNLAVKCGAGSLILETVKPEGRSEMSGRDFLNGLKDWETKIFI
jgi:methionyl-tRNA formyltransferase